MGRALIHIGASRNAWTEYRTGSHVSCPRHPFICSHAHRWPPCCPVWRRARHAPWSAHCTPARPTGGGTAGMSGCTGTDAVLPSESR